MKETTELTGRKDPLYQYAIELIIESKRISPSYVQRRLKISYRRAELLCNAVIESLMAKSSDHIAASGKLMLTAEQAQQIEVALDNVINDWVAPDDFPFEDGEMPALDGARNALATIRAARAQDLLTIEAAEKMGATGAEPTETERQLFEAWMKGHCWAVCGKWDGKQYVGTDAYDDLHPYVMHTRGLWAAWRDRAALAAPQPMQEPVAIVDEIGLCLDGRPIFNAVGKVKVGQKLYAAPVRTKDLAEQEIQDAIINISPTGTGYFLRIARAVIAADREKNK